MTLGNFKTTETKLGAKLIMPFAAPDNRGMFIKDYNFDVFHNIEKGLEFDVKELLSVKSTKGVLRGMHFQLPKPQAKIVRCIKGHIYDCIVNIDPDSPTFGMWEGFHLTEENMTSLLVPKNFAHGYLVLSDEAYVQYMCDETYCSWGDTGLAYDDPKVGIKWPFEAIGGKANLIMSEKDQNLLSFEDIEDNYRIFGTF